MLSNQKTLAENSGSVMKDIASTFKSLKLKLTEWRKHVEERKVRKTFSQTEDIKTPKRRKVNKKWLILDPNKLPCHL